MLWLGNFRVLLHTMLEWAKKTIQQCGQHTGHPFPSPTERKMTTSRKQSKPSCQSGTVTSGLQPSSASTLQHDDGEEIMNDVDPAVLKLMSQRSCSYPCYLILHLLHSYHHSLLSNIITTVLFNIFVFPLSSTISKKEKESGGKS